MKFWLAYSGAFVVGGAALSLVFYIAFNAVMSGYRVSDAGAILLLIIAPALTGFLVGGITFGAFNGQAITLIEWIYLMVLLAAVVGAGMSLFLSDALREMQVRWAMIITLFVGGAAILRRRAL